MLWKTIQKVKTFAHTVGAPILLQPIIGFWCSVWKFLKQLYVGTCHVVSAEISMAMAVPIENPAGCEMRSVIHFLQADDILGYLAEEVNDIRGPCRPKSSWNLSYRWRKIPKKNLTQETSPDRGLNPDPLRDRRAWYRLLHSGRPIYKLLHINIYSYVVVQCFNFPSRVYTGM